MDFFKCNKLFNYSKEIENKKESALYEWEDIRSEYNNNNYKRYEDIQKIYPTELFNNNCANKYNDYFQVYYKCRDIESKLYYNMYGSHNIATINSSVSIPITFKQKFLYDYKDKIKQLDKCYNELLEL